MAGTAVAAVAEEPVGEVVVENGLGYDYDSI